MTLLLDIATYAEPVRPEATGREIYQRFEDEPDTLAIAVVDADHRPVGLIERNDFLVRMAAQYGHALWSGRPISEWLEGEPVTADGGMTVAEFCNRMLAERPSELLHGFIVTQAGRYAGVGTALALLQATAAATASHAQDMAALAEEARASSRAAHEALAAKGRFLAVMSHEIRTPLNGVLAVAEIVRRKLEQADLAPLVDTILESGGVLLRLLNDALDLSRAEASGLELTQAPVKPKELLDEVVSLWAAKAELKGIALTAAFEGDVDQWVMADSVRVRQVLHNLISNAVKFARGQAQVRVAIRHEQGLAHLRAVVSDNGPGVPEDRLQTIFDPFHQTEEGLKLGGAGLGLAVCRQIAERMGGAIWAETAEGGGARFIFEAPLALSDAPGATTADALEESAGDALHVLVVDDNPTNRMVAQTLCTMFGCTSEAVADGAAAVEQAASGRFDLILMDVKMPGMDGVEATRRIRAAGGRQPPILALTANVELTDVATYRSCGMDGIVEKPVKPERLLEAMNEALAGAAPESASVAA